MANMNNSKLTDELNWRGFVNQTTYKDINELDKNPVTFYFGVDPSADSMQIGNLAMVMMVRHFVRHGHKAVLLVGGATGLIGDPDGKAQERDLKSLEEIAKNKAAIAAQYQTLLGNYTFEMVDNYNWFKGIGYLEFLREVGKHVPMRQMLGRDFVQTRLGEDGSGISYAEFSYSLIQGYDFLHLHREKGVNLQICGADQWGNSITGVDLVRRITGDETHVWSAPLVVNKVTGIKFGKSEGGAVWLSPSKTSPTQFYQFWINVDDQGVEDYLKIYTELSKDEITQIIAEHTENPGNRYAQKRLANEVTQLVHGSKNTEIAQEVTNILTGQLDLSEASDEVITELRKEIASTNTSENGLIIEVLVATGLASSNTEARRLIQGNAISINGQKVTREQFEHADFQNGRLLLRKGKKFKDSSLVEL
jgi:tyrosyl-tRNA synthetase